MRLKINGRVEQVMEVRTLQDLLKVKGLEDCQMVMEHNGVIIKSDSWSQVILNDGDTLEFFRLVGGG